MNNRAYRPLMYAAGVLVLVWAVVAAIYYFSGQSRMTVDKLNQYMASLDLARLSDADRERALEKYADMINELSPEDRMAWRRQDDWKKWFSQMTEAERAKFIEKTLPSGFKQMMDAFSQLPPDQRKKMIDNAVSNLKNNVPNSNGGNYGNNGPPPLSPELEQEVRQIGLQELYTQSSPETKAELSPLIEQLQMQVHNSH
jgi:hypothetical protein